MPHWNLTVDLKPFWNNEEIGFEEKRDKIVEAIKASKWREWTPYPDYFDELVDNVAAAENVDVFDCAWDEIYDLADDDRVWIVTF